MARRAKYNNVRTVVDGVKFQSKKEAERYIYLKTLVDRRLITDLECQPRFPVAVAGQHICYYYADFRYRDAEGKVHVEDVKGMITDVFRIKQKLVEAIYKIKIEIIK